MDTETSQIDPKRKEPKRATQRFQNHWFPICFRSVLYRGGGDGGGGALPPFPYTTLWFCENPEILSIRSGFYYCFGTVSHHFRKTKGGDMELAARPGGSSIIQGSQNEPRNEPKFGPNRIAHVASKRLPPRSQEGFRSFCNLCAKRCTGKPLQNILSDLLNASCKGLTRNTFLGMF